MDCMDIEVNWVSAIPYRRSAHGRRPAPGTGNAGSAGGEVFSRDRGPGACRVYPQSGFRFRAIGREDLSKQESRGQCKGNREAFRSTRANKNAADCAVRVLEALRFTLKRLSMDTSPAALFREPPVIRFTAQRQRCLCGKRLLVQKSRRKKVLRMTGPLIAHETVAYCPGCGSVFGSDALRQLVPAHSNVAYDVMVFVGRTLFQRNRTTEETRPELAARIRDLYFLGCFT